MRVQQISYLKNLIYYLIKNLKNLKEILNNYYLRNANKLRSEQLENRFIRDEERDNISKLSFEKEMLASLINNEEISDQKQKDNTTNY